MSETQLPESDHESFDGSKKQINVTTLRNELCTQHVFILDGSSREIRCTKCSFASKYTPSTLELNEQERTVTIKGVKHKFNLLTK